MTFFFKLQLWLTTQTPIFKIKYSNTFQLKDKLTCLILTCWVIMTGKYQKVFSVIKFLSFWRMKRVCTDGRNVATHNIQQLGMWAVFQAAIIGLVWCDGVHVCSELRVQRHHTRWCGMHQCSQKYHGLIAHLILIYFWPLCIHQPFIVTNFWV